MNVKKVLFIIKDQTKFILCKRSFKKRTTNTSWSGMYIPVQISGRFPDSGIHTGSSLPSYTASDRCCGTIASYSSITVTRSYRICTCFPFTLWTLQNDESSEAPVIIYSIVRVVVRIESRLIFYSIAWYKTKRNMFGRALGFVLAAITMMRNKL